MIKRYQFGKRRKQSAKKRRKVTRKTFKRCFFDMDVKRIGRV